MEIKSILNKMIEKNLGKDFGEKFEAELDKILEQDSNKANDDTRKELRDQILSQYRTLLNLLHVKAPHTVKISADEYTALIIDEKIYDLSICFSHNDPQATECIMAIEALFCDLQSVTEHIDQDIVYIENNLVIE